MAPSKNKADLPLKTILDTTLNKMGGGMLAEKVAKEQQQLKLFDRRNTATGCL